MSPFAAVSTKHREGCTQPSPFWLRGVWVISSRCPQGQGRARSHCPNSGWASRVTGNPSSSGETAESPDPAAHQELTGCEPGPASTSSILGHTPGQTDLQPSPELQAPALRDGTQEMIILLWKCWLKHHSFFQHSSSHPSQLVTPS